MIIEIQKKFLPFLLFVPCCPRSYYCFFGYMFKDVIVLGHKIFKPFNIFWGWMSTTVLLTLLYRGFNVSNLFPPISRPFFVKIYRDLPDLYLIKYHSTRLSLTALNSCIQSGTLSFISSTKLSSSKRLALNFQ